MGHALTTGKDRKSEARVVFSDAMIEIGSRRRALGRRHGSAFAISYGNQQRSHGRCPRSGSRRQKRHDERVPLPDSPTRSSRARRPARHGGGMLLAPVPAPARSARRHSAGRGERPGLLVLTPPGISTAHLVAFRTVAFLVSLARRRHAVLGELSDGGSLSG